MANKKAVSKANLELALTENNKKVKEYVNDKQIGKVYVNETESEEPIEVAEGIDADKLGGRTPDYYVNVDNYNDLLNTEADFLTEKGYGKLRYYNGVLQYYNQETSTWIDTSITPENKYIINMTPQTMQSISAVYDIKLGNKIKLKWEEPADTVIDGQVACLIEKVVIRRKLSEAPENENDGELVTVVNRKQFGLYKNTYYTDDTFTPNIGEEWFYKAFPMSTTGFYNYSSVNETSVLCKDYYIYGFRIDQTESDPNSMITYIADNEEYSPAYMDYSSDTFNYGSWQDAWFMDVKPCMLKYDGTVDYYLDPNDYTKKEDGTDSDVANVDFEGNAMVQFPKVYYKCVNITDDVAEYYFSDKKIDDDYHCWSHIDANGNEIDYCYMPIYSGSNVNSTLRSISGRSAMNYQTVDVETTYALANNQTEDIIWYTEVFSDRQLVNLLLLLIGKSTNTQIIFGNGHYSGFSSSATLANGVMNAKGLFWGTNSTGSGVKVFGMENWWGNLWHRIAGWINNKGTQQIKLTYGQSDGSIVDGYNATGSGYITLNECTLSASEDGYINKMKFTEYGLMPIAAKGSSTTYYCDGLYPDSSQVNYAIVGGCNCGSLVGALDSRIKHQASTTVWYMNASLSCKPLAPTN